MITPSPENYCYLEVNRPIVGGDSRSFVAGVREVGRRVLGEEIVASSSISEYSLPAGDLDASELAEPVTVVTPVTQPLLDVSSGKDLRMILMHRGVPADMASRYSLSFNAAELERTVEKYMNVEDDEGERHRAEKSLPPLKSLLNDISVSHGLDPAETEIFCDNFCIMGEPGDDLILTLTPRTKDIATRALHEQAKAASGRLGMQSRRLGNPVSGSLIGVPFARVPEEISDIQYGRLIDGVQKLASPIVRLVMGEPKIKLDN